MIDHTFNDGRTITREALVVLGHDATLDTYERAAGGSAFVLSLAAAPGWTLISVRSPHGTGAAWFFGNVMVGPATVFRA